MTLQSSEMAQLLVSNGAEPVPLYREVASIETLEMEIFASYEAATDIQSHPWARLKTGTGRLQARLELEGRYQNEAAERQFRTASLAGQPLALRLLWPNQDRLEGSFLITRYRTLLRAGAPERFTLEITGQSLLQFTPS
jgi:predicted secreted protein